MQQGLRLRPPATSSAHSAISPSENVRAPCWLALIVLYLKKSIKIKGIPLLYDPRLSEFKSLCFAMLENHLPCTLEASFQALLLQPSERQILIHLEAGKRGVLGIRGGEQIPEFLCSL